MKEEVSLIGTDMEQNWFKHGNCFGKETSMFFPETGDNQTARRAVKLCSSCVVKAECLSYALNNNEKFGVWGGFTTRKRKKLRRIVSIPCTAEDCKKKVYNETVQD